MAASSQDQDAGKSSCARAGSVAAAWACTVRNTSTQATLGAQARVKVRARKG